MKISPTCYLIGQDNLLLECAKILNAHSFLIKGIISPSHNVQAWAHDQQIDWFSSLSEVDWQDDAADYLFSIVNREIIPLSVLQKIRELVINYHDAPLPRYAGSNATSWAILKHETVHGITWHVINERIDSGDILKQVAIPILADEIAINLNMKCMEQAIASFSELVGELLDDTYQRIPQDLSQRTYFACSQKPIGNGWIDWNTSAEEIERLLRATEFCGYRNPFTVAKMVLKDDALIINDLTVLSEQSSSSPGRLLEVNQRYWKIATKTYNVLLSSLSTAQGQPIKLDVLAHQHNVIIGTQLPLPTQADYEQFLMLSQQCFPHEAYWVEKLKSFEPTVLTSQESEVNLQRLPNSLYLRFLDFAQDTTNLPLTVLAAWLVYLRRLENQTQIGVFIRPPHPHSFITANLTPFFATHLPLSVSINDDGNFECLVKQVEQEYHQLRQQKTYLYDCYQRYPELAVVISTDNSGCQINLGAIEACDDEAAIKLPKPFLTLCEELLRHPYHPIAKVGWITQQETQQLLLDWNMTETPYPAHKTIHQLFEEQVAKTPHNNALVYEDVSLTYSELNDYVNNLAHHLIENFSIKPDDLVVIFMEKSHLTLIAMLAILKSGGAYVSIAPSYPDERIQFIINDTKSALILTHHILHDRIIKLTDNKTLTVLPIGDNELASRINISLKENPASTTTSSHLAYVIYTSGTTGQPKGVMTEHKSVVNLLFMQAHEFALSALSLQKDNEQSYRRCLGFANPVFDAHVWEYYVTLLNGHTLYLVNNETQKDIEKLSSYIKQHNIYMATLPPILLDCSHLLPLKRLIVAGEKTDESVLQIYFKNGVEVINAYGPTETTVCATMHRYKLNDIASNIGKPISNAQIYILDSQQQLLPILVKGEIYIGGAGLARGYLNQPALTKEKFVINPFQTEEEKRLNKNGKLYKSGDVGRWLPDGTIEYIGRNDDQIKIRGHRIELGEIENVLLHYPDSIIERVAILSRGATEKYLVAYYTSTNEIKSHKLEQYLVEKLPSYMLPRAYVYVNAFPYTINGKLNHAALPSPEFKKKQENNATATQLEAIVCNAYAQVLDMAEKEIDIYQDFFKIGGNSLSAIRLTAKLRSYLDVSVRDIFELKTPNKIAHFLPVSAENMLDRVDNLGKFYINTIPFASKDWIESSNSSLLQKQHQYLQRSKQFKFSQTTKKLQRVLLTGSTGHLGCHILEKLLHETSYILYLPIRASSEEMVWSRLNDQFQYYFDSDLLPYQSRIVVFNAEIEKPNLGLATEKYDTLISQIDSVIHCAALVKHVGYYDEFYQANIQTTRNLLDFAKLTCNQDFHYISTVSVPSWGYFPGECVSLFTEEDDVSKIVLGNSFYIQTKYQAELLIGEYRERGVQSSIYRVGNLGMNSVNYRTQKNIEANLFFSHFKSMIHLQMVPHEFSKIEWSPVDYTALAIVKLFDKAELNNQTHHIFNPHICDLFKLLNNFPGLSLKTVHINEFVKEVLVRVNTEGITKAPHLLSLYQLWVNEIHSIYSTKIRLSQERTEHILAAQGFHWPKITIKMLCDFVKKSIET